MSDDRGRSLDRKSDVHSRWSDEMPVSVPCLPLFVPDVLEEDAMNALLLRYRMEEIEHAIAENKFDHGLRSRSPSPPPVYDRTGRRINTRDQRAKERLEDERERLVQKAKTLSPNFQPHPSYRPCSIRKTRKIYIPTKEYPDYKFIGLILGPRGLTHRQMEEETGAKIAIRGRGSTPEGRSRRNVNHEEDDDDLHVLIIGATEEVLDHAEALVSRLLIPIAEGQNDIKRKQLRKLAEITGTLRHTDYAEMQEIRNRKARGTPCGVYCDRCKDSSHPASDCSVQFPRSIAAQSITQEYLDLMRPVGEVVDSIHPSLTNEIDAEYEALLQSVGAQSSSKSLPLLLPSPSSSIHPWDAE